MKPGVIVAVPELPGRWQVWSKSAETPGAHFVVPAGAAARASGAKYAVIRITDKKGKPGSTIELLRTDPAFETLQLAQDAS